MYYSYYFLNFFIYIYIFRKIIIIHFVKSIQAYDIYIFNYTYDIIVLKY